MAYNQFLVAAFVTLTCLLAEYVNMLNTAKSMGGPRKQTGKHFSCQILLSHYISSGQRSVYKCVQMYHSKQDFSLVWETTTSQKVNPSNTLVVKTILIHLCAHIHTNTHMKNTHTALFNPPLLSLSAPSLLGEVAADIQSLLVHLSHVLQVPQHGEAAIVRRGAFRSGATAELGSLERRCCLEALEVGEL